MGCGFFIAAANRYIEECSPPQKFSLVFTIYQLGVSMNRPIVMLASFMVPGKKPDPTADEIKFLI